MVLPPCSVPGLIFTYSLNLLLSPIIKEFFSPLYLRSHGSVWKYQGVAFVDGKKMADAQWAATIVDRKK